MTTANPTTTPSDAEASTRSRILSHMNTDHRPSLILFSRHYSRLPLSTAKTSTLTSITTSHMIITSSNGRNIIPFDPPMQSLSETRERVVAMHHDAMKALDVEDVVVEGYVLPNRWWQWGLGGSVLLSFGTLWMGETLNPSSNSNVSKIWTINGLLPLMGELAYQIGWPVWCGMMVIHLGEAGWMAGNRLRRFQVEVFSGVWWKWVVDCFVEGFGAFVRFDQMVEGMRGGKKVEGLKKG